MHVCVGVGSGESDPHKDTVSHQLGIYDGGEGMGGREDERVNYFYVLRVYFDI